MNKLDRLKIFVNHLIVCGFAANQKGLGIKMGYSNESSFSQILNGKVDFPKNFINKLEQIFPDLNANWLHTGNGVMLKSLELSVIQPQQNNGCTQTKELTLTTYLQSENKDLKAQINELNKQIGKLEGKLEDAYELIEYLKKELSTPG